MCICCCQVALAAAAAAATSSASLPLWKTLVSRFHPRKLQLQRRLTKCSDDNVEINPSKSTPSPRDIDSAAVPFFSPSLDKESAETASSDTVLRDYLPRRRRQEQLQSKLRDWWDNLPPRFHEPRTWGRWMASGVQIGLVVYLVHAVFKVRQMAVMMSILMERILFLMGLLCLTLLFDYCAFRRPVKFWTNITPHRQNNPGWTRPCLVAITSCTPLNVCNGHKAILLRLQSYDEAMINLWLPCRLPNDSPW